MININHIENVLRINDELFYEFGSYSKIYLMTTENIREFLQCYSLQDSSILTVCGSGDQVLNSYLLGAKNVTCFDINPLAFYQVCLKKAAVQALNYQEFLNFFFHEFHHLFDKDLFYKIENYLDEDSYEFFKYIYSKYNSPQILNKIYYDFIPSLEHMKRMNLYLQKDNYDVLRDIMRGKEPSFIESDVRLLPKAIGNKKYDMIMLSNISESIDGLWRNEPLIRFKELIYSLCNNLNTNGTLQVGYIYDYYSDRQEGMFGWKKERQRVFDTSEFHTNLVSSFDDIKKKDAIITYFKKK